MKLIQVAIIQVAIGLSLLANPLFANEFRLPELQEKLIDRLPERLGNCEITTVEGNRYFTFKVKKGDSFLKLNFNRKDLPTGLEQIDYMYTEPYYNYGRGDEVESTRKFHHYSSKIDRNGNETVKIHVYSGWSSSSVLPKLYKSHFEASFDTEGQLINFKAFRKSTKVLLRPVPELMWEKSEPIECRAE